MFGKNKEEKRLQKEREAEEAKANAEFDAKLTAKQERKKVEKTVAEMDKSVSALMERAAGAKVKGYTDMYRSCISMIKVARARKRQAEMFLFQMDAMQEMQSLAKNSQELLGSMSNVMNSLGKLSLDKTVMMNSQRDFAAVQRELERQTMSIDSFLGTMEMQLPNDGFDASDLSDSSIEAEIDEFINGGSINLDGAPASASSPSGGDVDIERIKGLLNS